MTTQAPDLDWLDGVGIIDWQDARAAHHSCRAILRRLAADRAYLARLIRRTGEDPRLFEDCDHHPVMDRLTLYKDSSRGLYLRLHLSPGTNELIPHDHKYGFTTYILKGSYVHVWRRRDASVLQGPFDSSGIAPGTISVEREGSCYTLFQTLVHQTVMAAGTVTLFLRGPERQRKSHAASDMLHLLTTAKPDSAPGSDPRSLPERHTDGQRPLSTEEYATLVQRLIDDQVIVPWSASTEKAAQ